ncbi:MAG: tRNA lysidine(34) synthetase TilS, partial [Bdellovibrionales bacterium]|nr:tRNA lysidine(34) synthetase TilS [Bdellovibrionales bacterium]
MKEHTLISKNKKIVVSVSGGVDSLTLAETLHRLQYSIELLHFNHGTRTEENSKEEKLVGEFANSRGLNLHTVYLKMSLDEKNFEKKARLLRQKTYKSFIENNYWVYTAHHIDDSFEWSLMQSFKQGSLEHSLGIPVFNNGIVRPFMCATKKHIQKYARISKLSWFEDSSNKNLKFERNYLRAVISAKILEKYPKALAHYVAQSNEKLKIIKLNKESNTIEIRKEKWGVLLISSELGAHKEEIKNQIAKLSNKDRGLLSHEVDKLVSTHQEIKSHPE